MERKDSTAAEPTDAPSALRVAMAQIAPMLGDLPRNLALHVEQIEAARRQHADLIVFPELSLTGYFVRDMVPDLAISPAGPEIRQIDRGRRDRCRWWSGSSKSRRSTASTTPRFWAEGGRVIHVHRKVYLPTYGLFDEQRYFAAGERFMAFDTARLRPRGNPDLRGLLAPLGRRDHAGRRGRSAAVRRQLARPGRRRAQRSARRRPTSNLAKTFAQMLGAAVVVVNRVGFEDGLCFWGGSMAVGPDGRTIAQAAMLDPALCVGRIRPGRAAPAAADHARWPATSGCC